MARVSAVTEAVPARATGYFHELSVAPQLRETFACAWIHELGAGASPPMLVAPDATIDLQWIDGALRVAGPDRDPQTEILPAGTTVTAFRFRTAAAASWLGVPALELVGRRVPLEDLWGSRAREIEEHVCH